MSDDPNTGPGPWHAGERELQARIGAAERMADLGSRVIRRFLLDQHRAFYAQLPFIVAGSVDAEGDAWATLLCGQPGFLAAPTDDALHMRLPPDDGDPARSGMRAGDPVGLLGIELHTRRRNRVNGRLMALDSGEMAVAVEESFGNCPQYIQLRDYAFVRDPQQASFGAVETAAALDAEARRTIAAADTFFVASYADPDNCERRVDVSHRGGKAGFVRVDADGTLTIPDFAGNKFFSTLGNFLTNGKAGLVFASFETGDLLQLSGDAELVPDASEVAAFEGAERFWRFRARRMVRRSDALPLRWVMREDGWSPKALATGHWESASALASMQPAPLP